MITAPWGVASVEASIMVTRGRAEGRRIAAISSELSKVVGGMYGLRGWLE